MKEIMTGIPEDYCSKVKKLPKEINKSRYKTRDKLMLELIFYTGLKTSEIKHLQKEDINLDNQSINLKNREYGDTIYFNSVLAFDLKRYLKFIPDENHLFTSSRGNNISVRTIQVMTKKFTGLTPNQIRNIFKKEIKERTDKRKVKLYIFGRSPKTRKVKI